MNVDTSFFSVTGNNDNWLRIGNYDNLQDKTNTRHTEQWNVQTTQCEKFEVILFGCGEIKRTSAGCVINNNRTDNPKIF